MTSKKITLILALLVLAIFAVGSVSATDNITADSDVSVDDVVVDEVPTDDVVESEKIVEPTRASHIVNNSMSNSAINQEIVAAYNDNTNHVVDFTTGTYYGASFTVQNNVVLDGHGSTLIGDGTNDIFLVTQKSNFTIKNFIIDLNGSRHGIYGHHVYNSIITNNTISNGEDGINIYQVHENLTITDNTIDNMSGDGISLVNFNTYTDAEFNSFIASTVSGNTITNSRYGMFFGGNFKGVINNNTIRNAVYAMEFAGKKSASNGKLNVEICNNIVTNVTTGINMRHPHVKVLNIHNNTFNTTVPGSNYVINVDGNFSKDPYGIILVINNVLNGIVNQTFKNNTNLAYGNSGSGAYTKP